MQGQQDSELPGALELQVSPAVHRTPGLSLEERLRELELSGLIEFTDEEAKFVVIGRWVVSCTNRAGEQQVALPSRLAAALRRSASPHQPYIITTSEAARQQICTEKLLHVVAAPSDMIHSPHCCSLSVCSISQPCYMTACSTGNHYTVKLNDERHICRCVDFCCRGRQRPCKHLTLVMQQLGMTSDNAKGWHQVRHLVALTWSFQVSPL